MARIRSPGIATACSRLAALALGTAAALAPGSTHAQTTMLKCRDADGYVTYTDRGCDKPVEVRDLRVGPGSVVTGRPRPGGANADPDASAPPARSARRQPPGGSTAARAVPPPVASSPSSSKAASPPPAVSNATSPTPASPPAAASKAVSPTPASQAAASPPPADEATSERTRLQAAHDEVRQDVNRARTMASRLGGLTAGR